MVCILAGLVRATWSWSNVTCHGLWRNNVCVYGTDDIPHIINVTDYGPIVANKFQSSVDPYVVPCLDEMLFN